jgi:hypothetical protein
LRNTQKNYTSTAKLFTSKKIVNEHVYGAKEDVYFEACYNFAKGDTKITVKHSENKGKTVFRTMNTLKKICL